MKIDGNELAILQNDLDRRGQKTEASPLATSLFPLIWSSLTSTTGSSPSRSGRAGITVPVRGSARTMATALNA